MRALGVAVVLALALLLVGCEDESAPPQEPVITLAKVDGWRDGLGAEMDAWRQQESVGLGSLFGLVEIVFDDATAQEAWSDNVPEGLPAREGRPLEEGIYGELDEVDFATHGVLVWSSGQSGTCPGWLADIEITTDGELEARRGEQAPGDVCTDDYNPYRMVLAVALDRLPEPDDLPAGVDLEGMLTGLATAYPFSAAVPAPGMPPPNS